MAKFFSEKEEERMYNLLKTQYISFQKQNFDLVTNNIIRFFEKRYVEAKEQKIDMVIFFEAERKAFSKFKGEILEAKKNEKNSAVDEIYEKSLENIYKYPAVPIHKNASKEVESLLGALMQFHKNHIVGINALKDVSKEIENNLIYQDIVIEIKEICYVNRDEGLPTAFNSYKFKLEIYEKNELELERANMEILKKAMFFLRKVKKLSIFIDKITFKLNQLKLKKIPYQEKSIFLEDFCNILERQVNQILKDFRLEEFY